MKHLNIRKFEKYFNMAQPLDEKTLDEYRKTLKLRSDNSRIIIDSKFIHLLDRVKERISFRRISVEPTVNESTVEIRDLKNEDRVVAWLQVRRDNIEIVSKLVIEIYDRPYTLVRGNNQTQIALFENTMFNVIDLRGTDTSKVKSLKNWFKNSSADKIIMDNLDLRNAKTYESAFEGSYAKEISLRGVQLKPDSIDLTKTFFNVRVRDLHIGHLITHRGILNNTFSNSTIDSLNITDCVELKYTYMLETFNNSRIIQITMCDVIDSVDIARIFSNAYIGNIVPIAFTKASHKKIDNYIRYKR